MAVVKLVVGLMTAVFIVLGPLESSGLYVARASIAASFAVAGAWMFIGQRDPRALALAIAFLLTASVFSDALVEPLKPYPHAYAFLNGLFSLQVDAFTPYFVWGFASTFPRQIDAAFRRNVRAALLVSLGVGATLFVANASSYWLLLVGAGSVASWLQPLSRHSGQPYYWLPQFALSATALVVLAARVPRANPKDRATALMFGLGLIACVTPTLLWLLMYSMAQDSTERVLPFRIAMWFIYPTLLATPFVTAYAIVVRQALDVRLVVRRAIQYMLARLVLLSAVSIPLVLLTALVYRNRRAPVSDLVTSPRVMSLLLVSAAGLLVLRGRRGLLDRLDRRFFRHQYDARATLTALVDGCRTAGTSRELAHVLCTEIDRALQLESVAIFLLDDARSTFVAMQGGVGHLPAESVIARRLSRKGTLEHGDDGKSDEFSVALPEAERFWLIDNGVRLLLPFRSTDRAVVGLLALGEKKSELPFSNEDRMLLAAVTSAAELTLASHRFVHRPRVPNRLSDAEYSDTYASECRTCGQIDGAEPMNGGDASCFACGGALQRAMVPVFIGDRFEVHARLGSGGMGVVYRGTDLTLGRPVALKTLPDLGPDVSMRLRREARAMATVSHPNLAQIYGAESWHGQPILVCEFVPCGTLGDRMKKGRLPAAVVLRLGETIATVLAVIHSSGLLHRDVKPTNIGLGPNGEPKLLDFGLAKAFDSILGTHAMLEPAARETRGAPVRNQWLKSNQSMSSSASFVVGTPLYMCPEAIAGDAPSIQFDLWSLAVVLFEALYEKHPFVADDGSVNRHRLMNANLPEMRSLGPAPLAAFFRTALARNPGHRFPSATAMSEELHALVEASDLTDAASLERPAPTI